MPEKKRKSLHFQQQYLHNDIYRRGYIEPLYYDNILVMPTSVRMLYPKAASL